MKRRSIKIDTPARRIGLIAAGILCLTAAFFFAKWSFANSIATRSDVKEVAEFTVGLAPNDPQTHYALAVLGEKSFLPGELAKAVSGYERATALSPHDFRLWLALGNARGSAGDATGAEGALRQALRLAPNYAQISWALGNNLIRQGRTREGFAEIRRAALSDPEYIKPTISTAALIFEGDLAEIRKHVGDSPEINAELALYLAGDKKFAEALETWEALPGDRKKTDFKTVGERLYQEMLAAKKFAYAFRLYKQTAAAGEADAAAAGKIYNGGFEADVDPNNTLKIFNWQLGPGVQPQIGFDDRQKSGGRRSLVIVFNSNDGRDFRTVAQTVVVEPDRDYKFEFSYRSELQTPATLRWDIVDSADGTVLASTEPIAEKTGWKRIGTGFQTGPETEAVTLRLTRERCGSTICPIVGKVWFDDLSIN